jgi:acyl-CoA thioester hydrolase
MIHRHEIRVRYGETDMMGVVHHSVYPLYFEEARTELMRAVGFRYADLEADGYLLPLADIGIRFIRGAVYDDTLVLTARLTEVTKVRVVIEYEVFRQADGERLATGRTHHACTGKDLRPRRLPAEVHEAFRDAVEPPLGEDAGRRPRQKGRSGGPRRPD